MTTPEQTVEAIKDYLQFPDETILPEILLNATSRFHNILVKQLTKEIPRTKEEVLSPSTLGKCTRQLGYAYHDFPREPFTYDSKFTFITGDIIELIIYTIAEIAGVPFEDIQKRIKVGEIEGNIDGNLGDYTVDVKTMSDAAYNIADRNGIDDAFGYPTQLQLYVEGTGKKKGAWICYNKNKGTLQVHKAANRPQLVEIAKNKREIVINSTKDALPSRDFELEYDKKSGRRKLAMQCKFCPYKYHCWEITGIGEGYNRSEVYYASGQKT